MKLRKAARVIILGILHILILLPKVCLIYLYFSVNFCNLKFCYFKVNVIAKCFCLLIHERFSIFLQVWCSGVFELRLANFKNEHGLNMNGTCCNGFRTPSSYGSGLVCSAPCHTFFTICLTHYQNAIPPNPTCTFGFITTSVFVGNNVDFDNSYPSNNTFRFQFENVTWPVSKTFTVTLKFTRSTTHLIVVIFRRQ